LRNVWNPVAIAGTGLDEQAGMPFFTVQTWTGRSTLRLPFSDSHPDCRRH